ncbi:MAG: RES family NAD+ phosphorylase [Pseudomonadaceae bacterium]|nr:RES family NAD+ phosphorylase [Pseudomonadaceae bacterium]
MQFNTHQQTSIDVPDWLKEDVTLIEETLGIGLFHYGPRLWMIGEVEPLKELQIESQRANIVKRVLAEYPGWLLRPGDLNYRVRKAPGIPEADDEYDSPPEQYMGSGRFGPSGISVLYSSPDLQVCLHECRVSAEDELYVATLDPTKTLRLLNLSVILTHEETSEFESLDMAMHMLFMAGNHSYDIAADIAKAAYKSGYDGLVYPSYFSTLRTGMLPLATTYGISHRRIPEYQPIEQLGAVPNIALFGRPIEQNLLKVKCINKVILRQVEYNAHFGPVGYT